MLKHFFMTTKGEIIRLADQLIRDKGYNAFSFYDISRIVGIKTASIHYHFPAKSDLGVAVIEMHIVALKKIIDSSGGKSPLDQLDTFFSIYSHIKSDDQVCLVGSLTTDLNTVDDSIKTTLKAFASLMLDWVSHFLEKGREEQIFQFEGLARTRAILIIGNMMSVLQLSRLTNQKDFKLVKDAIKKDLIKTVL